MDSIHGVGLLQFLATMAHERAWIAFCRTMSFLGSPEFYALVLPILFATAGRRRALRFASSFVLGAAAAAWLKELFGRPRYDPAVFGLSAPLEHPGAYETLAFPSGHSLMAMLIWGFIALRSPHRSIRILCPLLILAIAFSRLALLRHDLLDVGAGLVIGAVLLLLLDSFDKKLAPRLAPLPWIEKAGLWLTAALTIQLLFRVELSALALGVGAGLGAGSAAAASICTVSQPPAWSSRLLRAALALGGIAVLRLFVGPGRSQPELLLFGAYFIGGLWVAFAVPRWLGGVWEGD